MLWENQTCVWNWIFGGQCPERMWVYDPPCQMVNKSELELECREKGIVIYIDENFGLCYRIKPIKFQDVKIKEMILKLQEKARNVIYGNFSSFRS